MSVVCATQEPTHDHRQSTSFITSEFLCKLTHPVYSAIATEYLIGYYNATRKINARFIIVVKKPAAVEKVKLLGTLEDCFKQAIISLIDGYQFNVNIL